MKKIGIDMDGIVCDYQTYLLESLNERYHTNFKVEDWTDYYFLPIIRRHQFTKEDFWNLIKEHAELGAWKHLSPIKGAIESIRELKEQGHYIHIITHKLEAAKADTITWLSEYKIPYDSISFSEDKGKLCYLVGIDVMIEDSPKQAEDVANYGIETLLFDQPWNRNVNFESPLIQKVKDWNEILKIL